MFFSSTPFIFFFLPLLLFTYYIIPFRLREWRNALYLAASLFFYAWGEGDYTIVLVVSLLANHFLAGAIHRSQTRYVLTLGILLNLLILYWYKYAGFVTSIFGYEGWNTPEVPLGISVFTLQGISYLIDVSRGDAKPNRSIISTGVYIASFAQLFYGPIVQYKLIKGQLLERAESVERFSIGIKLFSIGLAQKVLIANILAEVADPILSAPAETISGSEAWYGLAAYGLHIYFEFAAYSNMALGIANMLGFKFPENFNVPYSAQSLTEFWQRWFITLVKWFKDYVYAPLISNRFVPLNGIACLWIVFLLFGLWHGSAWPFVHWGIYHGVFLTFEKYGLRKLLSGLWRPIRHAYLLFVVFLSWVLIAVDEPWKFYKILFGGSSASGIENFIVIEPRFCLFILIAFLFATSLPEKASERLVAVFQREGRRTTSVVQPLLYFCYLCLLFACIVSITSNGSPFVNSRF